MKSKILVLFIFMMGASTQAQEIVGKWKTFDDDTGEVRSIIELYERNDRIYGRISKIMDAEDRDNLCTECSGEDKNKKIEGLELMKNFRKNGHEYVKGTITNPDNGKVYKAKIWLDAKDSDILHVRGYIGFFYKTLEWKRV